ncbi:hypothetical protein Tco_1117899, partial [Tanacetum coccineum]
ITPPTTQTNTTVIPTETPIITPTIPPSPDYTPASPDYSPASDSESGPSEDPSSDHIPPLPAISLICTGIAKITRKRSKPEKHGHGNGLSAQEPEVSSKRLSKVNPWSTMVNPQNAKTLKIPKRALLLN